MKRGMESGRRARTFWLESPVLPAVVMFLLAGCNSPVGNSSNKSRSTAQTPSASRTATISESPNDDSPVTRMRVQGETVEAVDLWNEIREELDAKSRTLSPAQFRTYVQDRAVQLITDKIAEVLLYQRAKLRMPEGMDKKVEEFADGEIRKVVTADYDGVQRRYERKLEQQGRTLEAVRDQLKRQIVISSYLDGEIRPQVPEPTRAQLHKAFQNGVESWREPSRRSMSLINVRIVEFLPSDLVEPTREQSEAARVEARKRIDAAYAEIRAGATFAEVAKKYSQGIHAEEGGAWGWITADGVRERFQPAVRVLESLDSGQTSGIIETPDDFFIVHCDEHRPAVTPDFASVQPRIRDEVFRREFNRRVAELVVELRGNARIEPKNLERFHAGLIAAALDLTSAR